MGKGRDKVFKRARKVKPKARRTHSSNRPFKLQTKTKNEKEMLNNYYSEHPNEWERKEIKLLSEKTSLTVEKVYKYLWNKRNKEKNSLPQLKIEEDCDNLFFEFDCIKQQNRDKNDELALSNTKAPKTETSKSDKETKLKTKTIEIQDQCQIEVPENLLFVNEFFIPNNCNIPSYAEKLLSYFGKTLTFRHKIN